MSVCVAGPDPSDVARLQVEASVKRAVQAEGAELQVVWGGTLYHMDDLPFSLGGMPASYGDFRERLRAVAVRWAGGAGARGWLGCGGAALLVLQRAVLRVLWCMLSLTGCGPCCMAGDVQGVVGPGVSGHDSACLRLQLQHACMAESMGWTVCSSATGTCCH